MLYEIQKIVLNGDRLMLVDFYFKSQKLSVEIDGSDHKDQKSYHADRDEWLLRAHAVKTLRFSNQQVFKQADTVLERLLEVMVDS